MIFEAIVERFEAPLNAMVMETEIRWTLASAPVPDLANMTDDAILLEVLGDASTYRELARLAIAALRERGLAHERHLEQHHRLLDQYRTLRETTVTR